MIRSNGYAAHSPGSSLAPFSFERRDPLPTDIVIDISYCGVCHTDIHQVRDEWGGGTYPMVPGHEIVGQVVRVGSAVTRFKAGDIAAVGCMVDSCRTCANCQAGEEQYCLKGSVFTYNSPEPHTGGITYGGYSTNIVVDEAFTLSVSPKLDPARTAPLLCAGITTYSPLRHWNVGPGQKVGVIGLGGLGHMALKFARSFGAHVVQFTTSANKRDDALRLGANEVVLSKDENAMKAHAGTFDFILDTVSAPHDLNVLLGMLRRDGHLVLVGVPPEPHPVAPGSLIFGRKSLGGSLIGGIRQTQEMLDYCAEHDIAADIELIPVQKIDEAFDRTVRADVKYRFVIDLASLTRS
jgi:alcohol dehydrogenase (NADP+)